MCPFSLKSSPAWVGEYARFITSEQGWPIRWLLLIVVFVLSSWLITNAVILAVAGSWDWVSLSDGANVAWIAANGGTVGHDQRLVLGSFGAGAAAAALGIFLTVSGRQRREKGILWIGGIVLALGLYAVLASMAFGLYANATGFNSPTLLLELATDDRFPGLQKKALLGLATPLGLALLLTLPVLLKPRPLHGDARWASSWAAKKGGLLSKGAGVVLGKWGGRLIVTELPGHVLGVAPTRSGKGVGWVIPTLLQWKGSAVILDPKRENYEITAGFRSKTQKVALFDPFSASGSPMRWNPLAFVFDAADPIEEISKVAELLIPTPDNADPHWTSAARLVFIGIALHLNYRPRAVPLTMVEVLHFTMQYGGAQQLAMLVAQDQHPEYIREHRARRMLAVQASRPDKEAGSVLSTLINAMGLWELPSVVAATAANDIDLRQLRRSPASIYLAVPPDSLVRAARLLALFWQQVMDALTRELPKPDEKAQVLMLMDEFPLPGKMELIKQGLAFLAGYQVTVFVVIQSISQLTEVYGEAGGRSILDNCRYRAYMAPNDERAARALSDALGSTTVRVKSESISGIKRTRSYSLQRRPLLLPQEVLALGLEKLIVQVENGVSIRCRKIRYWKDRQWMRRVLPAPGASVRTENAIQSRPRSRGIVGKALCGAVDLFIDELRKEASKGPAEQTAADRTLAEVMKIRRLFED